MKDLEKRFDGLKEVFDKMTTGQLLKQNDVMVFFNTVWIDDDNEKELFVKFEDDTLDDNTVYQVFYSLDGSIRFDTIDEDDVLEIIEFNDEDLVEEWTNFYS